LRISATVAPVGERPQPWTRAASGQALDRLGLTGGGLRPAEREQDARPLLRRSELLEGAAQESGRMARRVRRHGVACRLREDLHRTGVGVPARVEQLSGDPVDG
jgi:hypothetical protein